MKQHRDFGEEVYSKHVVYTYNPLLNYAMSNAVIRQNQGLIKIDKDATTKRIDPETQHCVRISWHCITNLQNRMNNT